MRSQYFLGLIFCITVFFESIFAASIDGTTSPQYTTTHQVFHNGEYATGYVKLNSGATILEDATASFNILFPFSGALDLRGTGTLSLTGDLYIDTNCTLSGSGVIRGNGKTIYLDGNLTITDNSIIHINSDTIIDGQGHNLIFGRKGKLFVDTNITLTLRNMRIVQQHNDFTDPCLRLAAFKSQLALKDVELALAQDFLFGQGQLFVYGDVVVTGTSAFVYRSTQHSFIEPDSIFYFDTGTTFSVVPPTMTDCKFDQWPTYTSNNFILMSDKTSKMHFNEASLCTTLTGCRFAKGSVNFENKCFLQSNSILGLPSDYLRYADIFIPTDELPAYVAFSPDGNYLAVVNKKSNSLQIFNSSDPFGQVDSVITGNVPVYVSWSNTSTQLAVVNSEDNTVQVYNFDGANITLSVSASTGTNPSSCAWSLYGSYIAVTNSGSNTVQIFKSSTLSQIGSSVATGTAPSCVSWAPGDRILAVTNSGSNSLQIFSFDGSGTPTQIASSPTGMNPSSVTWSPSAVFLVVANTNSNTLQTFSFDCDYVLTLLQTISTDLQPVSTTWSLDGKNMAVANYGSGTLQTAPFYDLTKMVQVGSDAPTGSGSFPWSVVWSPDGNFLAEVNRYSSTLRVFEFDGSTTPTIVGWNAYTEGEPMSVSWSPDGNFLAVVQQSATPILEVFSFDGSSTPVKVSEISVGGSSDSVSWSSVGNFIAVVSFFSDTLQVFEFDGSSTLVQVGSDVITADRPEAVAWSPAGNFIAVVSEGPVSGRKLQVFSFDVSSPGTPVQVGGDVATGSAPGFVSWSPDGNFIAVINEGSRTLQVFSFDGYGTPIQVDVVSTVANPYEASWSPDGRFIAVASYGSGALQIFSFNGSENMIQVGMVTMSGMGVSSVAWSPASNFIAVVSTTLEALQVFSVNVLSSNTQITSHADIGRPSSVSWGSSNSIAASSYEDNGVYLFEFGSSNIIAQVGSDAATGASPSSVSWAPGDRFMAVGCSSEIQIFSFDGSNTPVAFGNLSTSITTGVSWSPDIRFIAAVDGLNTLQVFSIDVSGTLTPVSSATTADWPVSVSWSPDGRFIAVISASGIGGAHKLQVFSFDGYSATMPLVSEVQIYYWPEAVAWSPDGRFIAVVKSTITPGALYIFSFDGKTLTQVGDGVPTNAGPCSISWSPDSRFAVVANSSVNTLQIFAFNGSSTPIQVGGDMVTGSGPRTVSWSPNRNDIAVANANSHTLQIFSFDGSHITKIGNDPLIGYYPRQICWSNDGNFIAVADLTVDALRVARVLYSPDRSTQAISNGFVFGDSAFGLDYDTAVSVLGGSQVQVDGKVNYDCVN